jgi:hypothetical protein
MPMSERKRISPANESDPFHIVHKVPAGDSPYVRAKHVQVRDFLVLELNFMFFTFVLIWFLFLMKLLFGLSLVSCFFEFPGS